MDEQSQREGAALARLRGDYNPSNAEAQYCYLLQHIPHPTYLAVSSTKSDAFVTSVGRHATLATSMPVELQDAVQDVQLGHTHKHQKHINAWLGTVHA